MNSLKLFRILMFLIVVQLQQLSRQPRLLSRQRPLSRQPRPLSRQQRPLSRPQRLLSRPQRPLSRQPLLRLPNLQQPLPNRRQVTQSVSNEFCSCCVIYASNSNLVEIDVVNRSS